MSLISIGVLGDMHIFDCGGVGTTNDCFVQGSAVYTHFYICMYIHICIYMYISIYTKIRDIRWK